MKFLLTLYLCSSIMGKCYTNPNYPVQKDTYADCVKDGLRDAHVVLFETEGITLNDIETNRLYVTYTCLPEYAQPTSLPLDSILSNT